VAVAERAAGDRIQTPVELRRIPIALTTGWGGSSVFGAPPAAAGAVRALSAAPPPPPAVSFDAPRTRLFRKVASVAKPGRSSEPAAPMQTDRVFDLLMTQRADGRFERSDALRAWLDAAREAALQAAIEVHGEAIAVTALVVAVLVAEAAERESEWLPAVTKARAWLAAQGATLDGAQLI
jgi:hypothetical protein